jgi:hypothetical protein
LHNGGSGNGAGGALLWGRLEHGDEWETEQTASVAKRTRQGRLKAHPSPLDPAAGARGTLRGHRTARGAMQGGRCLGAAYGRQMGRRAHDQSVVYREAVEVVRTPEQCADATWPVRSRHARDALGAATTSPGSNLIPFRLFRNCKTPKIVN